MEGERRLSTIDFVLGDSCYDLILVYDWGGMTSIP